MRSRCGAPTRRRRTRAPSRNRSARGASCWLRSLRMSERTEPDFQLPERELLEAWLDYHRATLRWKCEGLSDGQLKVRSVPPSTMSLLGLVRHMADVER